MHHEGVATKSRLAAAQKNECEDGGLGQWKGNTNLMSCITLTLVPGVAGKAHRYVWEIKGQ